jgi:hypothetical protein
MRIDLSRRMGLLVLGGVEAGIVFEKRDDEARVPLHIVGGPEYARRWIDSHYEGVEWESSSHRATALVGRLADPPSPSASESAASGAGMPIACTASPSATAAVPGLWPPATVSTYKASAAASGASRATSTGIRCAGNTEEETDGA